MNRDNGGQRRRIIWLLLLGGFTILLIWSGLKIWRSYQAASSLMARQAQAEVLLADGLTNLDPNSVQDLVYGIKGDVATLQDELGFLMPILPFLNWLPQVGPLASAAPQLIEMADAGTESAAFAYRGLAPALKLLQGEGNLSVSLLPELLGIVEDAKPDLAKASVEMDRLVAARRALGDTEQLPWRVRTLLETADPWLPLAADGLKVAQVLPELMGYHGPRRYLVMAQNENELRGTGGFISGAGLIELDNGRIVRIDFKDANKVDAFEDPDNIFGPLSKPYGSPPQPLTDFMLLDLFLFRDSNFWPDFPISAQKAMDLYSYGQDIPPVDGAFAIDQQFMALLLAGSGPIIFPESGEIVDQNNIIESLQNAWNLDEGVNQRKSFLSTFAEAIYNRLENEPYAIDPITLARKMDDALQQKHLQIYVREPAAERIFREIQWDGRLSAPNGNDTLLTVDTNVGYNKANLHIEKDILYKVSLRDDGTAKADLTVTHRHTGATSDEPCLQGTTDVYVSGSSYIALADKCYWNYLRVYVPEESRLINGPRHLVPADTWFGGYDWNQPTDVFVEIPGFTTFANFMLVPKGGELTSQYQYDLPRVVSQVEDGLQQYQLHLIRQAGAPTIGTAVQVTLPEGATLVSATPEPARIDRDTLVFESDLDRDQWISIVFK